MSKMFFEKILKRSPDDESGEIKLLNKGNNKITELRASGVPIIGNID